MATNRLEEAIRRLRGAPSRKVDTSPDSPFDALLDLRMKALERQMDEVKGRVNGLVFAVVGAIVVELILRLVK
jgi:hypothetical protein